MTDQVCTGGNGENFKCGVHLGRFALAAMAAGYNTLAYSMRRDRHLLVNAVVYSALVFYEAAQIRSHQEPS